ncbi:hypothetical protein BaRGS_00017153 [Batillaria attramentaria]|uniref:Uncharacterized protein n=1 Tax=Batillaria attramentaria TaxID=370345 RepID=A0ABD0KXD9_9CAEN
MSDLYEGQFRRAEKARQRNRHEERRLKQELDRKHGMRETHEYRMRVMREERQLIEKELGKIRMDIHRKSIQPDSSPTAEEAATRSVREEAADTKPGRSKAVFARSRAMSLQDVSEKFRTMRPDPVTNHVTSQHVQPSVGELLETALRNTVMYAVKHGENLQDKDTAQHDMDTDIARAESIAEVIRQRNSTRGSTSLSRLSDRTRAGAHGPDKGSTPWYERMDSTCSTMTSYSQVSSVLSTKTTPRLPDRSTRSRSTHVTHLTPRARYKRDSVADNTDSNVPSLTSRVTRSRRQTLSDINPITDTDDTGRSPVNARHQGRRGVSFTPAGPVGATNNVDCNQSNGHRTNTARSVTKKSTRKSRTRYKDDIEREGSNTSQLVRFTGTLPQSDQPLQPSQRSVGDDPTARPPPHDARQAEQTVTQRAAGPVATDTQGQRDNDGDRRTDPVLTEDSIGVLTSSRDDISKRTDDWAQALPPAAVTVKDKRQTSQTSLIADTGLQNWRETRTDNDKLEKNLAAQETSLVVTSVDSTSEIRVSDQNGEFDGQQSSDSNSQRSPDDMKPARQTGGTTAGRRYSQPVTTGAGADKDRRMSEIPTSSSANNLRAGDGQSGGQVLYDDKGTERTIRRTRPSKDAMSSDSPNFDPEHYNPDGSLRTVHKMPDFNTSYDEASKARYIRHRKVLDREKELSVNEVFEKP